MVLEIDGAKASAGVALNIEMAFLDGILDVGISCDAVSIKLANGRSCLCHQVPWLWLSRRGQSRSRSNVAVIRSMTGALLARPTPLSSVSITMVHLGHEESDIWSTRGALVP